MTNFNNILTKEFLEEKLLIKGFSYVEVAKQVGCHRTTVFNYAQKFGVFPVSKIDKILTKEFLQKELIDKNQSRQELSNRIGYSVDLIQKYLKKHRLSIIVEKHKLFLNKKFKHFKLIKWVPKGNFGSGSWLCLCNCGKTFLSKEYYLLIKAKKSCGCQNYKGIHGNAILSRDPKITTYKYIINSYKHAAKRRKLKWALTEAEVIKLINSDCFYCKTPPSNIRNVYITKKGDYRSCNKEWQDKATVCVNSIDRVDSSKGYIFSNCVPCCLMCNFAKGDVSYQEFLSWIDKLILNRGNLK